MPINTHSIFVINAQSPENLKKWLNHQASLTEMLQKIKGEAQLELISQNWVNTDWWDQNVLQIQEESIFKRDIIMKSRGVSYWFARSIIPKKCYALEPSFFDRLKNESIKNLIFGNDKVQRINSINYAIDHHCMEFYWVKKNINTVEGILWVRLAEFSFQQSESFYIAEIMLPELEFVL
ncbi:chorismate--pyruvate lyase family protein [Legionella longbeachae]|uniref:4-hydroxybenzoate synthetase n=1 Tax=Legionella longbeachae serogroup 1 (strain NSW150) TaxID=661367 RepID=D3HTC4_LEGLN|nr:chorismate lyase [Legionella longbeachae]VEE02657.1 4-hydroxybenzoate synthetase [Legionella oakridgensis]HBD7397920.1 chorismate lyase [Legionella pneumophila]ARB91077.1 chorismate lyase [Legionella longbeachae]ARM32495.1 chorismate lyase [Legionella longbeachae]EEZ94691.1 chorismate--pyruvate lyase [Legionella longbeachae D-4968]